MTYPAALGAIPRPRRGRRLGLVIWALAATTAAAGAGGRFLGYRLNNTASAPEGLWRVVQRAPLPTIRRGMIVAVCPPDVPVVREMKAKGYLELGGCPAGTVPFLKPVAAIAGDVVTIAPGKPVEVNGQVLPNTTQEADMPKYPAGRYRVAPGTVWLFSSFDPGSFDSRYFGPVKVAAVRAQVVPVLVRGNAAELTRGAILRVRAL